jgi:hypothetical protein
MARFLDCYRTTARYFPYARVSDEVRGLQECGVFDADELRAINGENALSLFLGYKGVLSKV